MFSGGEGRLAGVVPAAVLDAVPGVKKVKLQTQGSTVSMEAGTRSLDVDETQSQLQIRSKKQPSRFGVEWDGGSMSLG